MPHPLAAGLVTLYLLENPYPVGLVLLGFGGGWMWVAMRAGRRERLPVAGLLMVAGAAVFATARLVVTSGEHGRELTLALVGSAVSADIDRARELFAPDATLAFGAPTNPRHSRAVIERLIEQLDGRRRIESNTIFKLVAHSRTRREARVELSCVTTLVGGYGPHRTQWVLEIARQPDGTWKVTHVRWAIINGRPPAAGVP